MAIKFLQPWFLLLLFLATALLLVYNGRRRYPRQVRSAALVLRALLLLVLVLALSRPYLVRTHRGLSVVFLVDRSRSMEGTPDQSGWLNESLTYCGAGDRAAVLVFGRDVQLVKPFTMERLPALGAAEITRDHTDLEAALQTAAGLIPGDSNGRIILLSDGLETAGDSLAYAGALNASGISVDVLPVMAPAGDEAAVLDLALPRYTHPGRQVLVEVEVQSTVPTPGVLSLFWDGRLAFQEEVSLPAGRQYFSIPVETAGEGLVKVQAVLEPHRDTLRLNNTMTGLTFVEAPPRLLMVEGKPGQGQSLFDLMLLGGLEVHRVPPQQIPASPQALAAYRAVLLVDVPAYALTAEQQQNLEMFVRVLGGGVAAAGGKNSFGLGLYQDTPLEKLLPVFMEVESETELPGLDLLLVIDRSGSMSGEKLNMAKNAAIASLAILKERDRLGVITFDDHYSVALPLTSGEERDPAAVIESISVGGGTMIYPALEEAVRLLTGGKRAKQIILLSDGMEGPQYNYASLLEEMTGQGIVLSTIALGDDADETLMRYLAEYGDGRFYAVPESENLPEIFLQETVLAGGDYLVEEEFRPAVLHRDAVALGAATPLFYGYVASTAKPLAEVLLQTHREHPLLARWQYGLGRAVAFTSDTGGMWSEEFLRHPGFADLWTNLLTWITPRWGDEGIALEVRLDGAGVEISALFGEPLVEGERLVVSVTGEDYGETELEMQPVGGERYSARLEQVNEGVYLLGARREGGGGTVTGQAVSGFAVPYPAEYRIAATEAGRDLLETLSADTGGRVLRQPREAFRPPVDPVRRSTEISGGLILAAILLWPLDIAVRRFGMAPQVPAAFKPRSRRTRSKAEKPPPKSTVERLLEAKKTRGRF